MEVLGMKLQGMEDKSKDDQKRKKLKMKIENIEVIKMRGKKIRKIKIPGLINAKYGICRDLILLRMVYEIK